MSTAVAGVVPPATTTARRAGTMLVAALALSVAVLLSLALGTRSIDPGTVLRALLGTGAGGTDAMVVVDLRIPRTVIGLVAGAALGVAGAVMQGLTRNPLADPGLLGVNAGAAFGVVLAMSVLGIVSPFGYLGFALAGAAAAALLVYLVGSGRSGGTPVSLTLAGAAVTAALTSLVTLVLIGDIETLSRFRFWQVGSLVGRDLSTVAVVAPLIAAGVVLALVLGRGLDVLALGDDLARGLGQSVARTRVLAAVAVVLLCGGATSIAGPIAFVGLVVPHVARRFVGSDYRWIIALSALLGAALLILADVLGRFIALPGELEAGLVVCFVGAPVLIAIVRAGRTGAL